MTDLEHRFLEIYKAALQGKTLSKLEGWGRDRKGLIRLADIHRVFPMIYETVWKDVIAQEGDRIQEVAFRKAEKQTLGQARMTAEFLKLYQFLIKRGLSPIVMKGIICRSLYPHPEQRASSDEDLLIPEEMFDQYHRAFLDYGLKVASPEVDILQEHEIPYCNSQVYIELHKKPFPPESKAYGDLNRFFTDVEERKIREIIYGVPVCTMDHTDHLFYQLCHAFKHFLNCGIGIRLVSDIVLFSMTYEEKIDWKSVQDRCEDIHAMDFVRALYSIGDRYLFTNRFPGSLRSVWETDSIQAEPLLSDILTGGVFGTSSEERLHSANITLGTMASQKNGDRTPALMKTIFPSADSLRGRYPYLQKKPYLLPVAWLQRLFGYGINAVFRKGGRKQAAEAVRIGNERVELMRRYRILKEGREEDHLVKRLYKRSHSSFLAPVLSPVYIFISMVEYHLLNLIWTIRGDRPPTEEEKALVRENVTFIAKSFERQKLAKDLCRNITRIYPGASIIIADDSRKPLTVDLPNLKVLQLPFNSGLSAGLHEALKEVRTPYVMRLDDDELLTVRSKVHRELEYLMQHPELDLIGFGHTTAIRLHSPQFNFREYYKCPMDDAPLPLKIPHMTELDENHIVLGKVANIYLARTDKLREVGFDPQIKVIDHHDFFRRAAGIICSAIALDTVVFHRHNPYERGYNAYRSDYAADLEYINRKRRSVRRKESE